MVRTRSISPSFKAVDIRTEPWRIPKRVSVVVPESTSVRKKSCSRGDQPKRRQSGNVNISSGYTTHPPDVFSLERHGCNQVSSESLLTYASNEHRGVSIHMKLLCFQFVLFQNIRAPYQLTVCQLAAALPHHTLHKGTPPPLVVIRHQTIITVMNIAPLLPDTNKKLVSPARMYLKIIPAPLPLMQLILNSFQDTPLLLLPVLDIL